MWCGVMSNCNRRPEAPGCVWVVRESLVGLCVYFGGTKKDFVEGGGDQINRGGPRIAWPVLGTPALLAHLITFLVYYFSLPFSDYSQSYMYSVHYIAYMVSGSALFHRNDDHPQGGAGFSSTWEQTAQKRLDLAW